jgi:hypothetical protein
VSDLRAALKSRPSSVRPGVAIGDAVAHDGPRSASGMTDDDGLRRVEGAGRPIGPVAAGRLRTRFRPWAQPAAGRKRREEAPAVRLDGDDGSDPVSRRPAAAVRRRLPAPRLGTGGPA